MILHICLICIIFELLVQSPWLNPLLCVSRLKHRVRQYIHYRLKVQTVKMDEQDLWNKCGCICCLAVLHWNTWPKSRNWSTAGIKRCIGSDSFPSIRSIFAIPKICPSHKINTPLTPDVLRPSLTLRFINVKINRQLTYTVLFPLPVSGGGRTSSQFQLCINNCDKCSCN